MRLRIYFSAGLCYVFLTVFSFIILLAVFQTIINLGSFPRFLLSVKWDREIYSDLGMHSAVQMLCSCVVISINSHELHVPLMLLFQGLMRCDAPAFYWALNDYQVVAGWADVFTGKWLM